MSFLRYPKYKDSGVEWLGEVPEHWGLKSFRRVFRESSEKIDREVVGPMLSVSGYRGIEVKDYDDENRRRLDDELVGYRIVRVGQLVVNTMWLNYAGLGVSEHEGHVSPAYRCYWFSAHLEPRFVHHLLRSGLYVQGYTRLLTGVRPNSLQMSRDDLMAFPVLLPSATEQLSIAAFLDRETAKVDELVEEQRRLIALLQEKRQATISHAVTKGLNPDAPMKPSGIEWLGDVPAHWQVRRVKSVSSFTTSGPRGWSEMIGELGALFVQSGDLDDDLRIEFARASRVIVADSAEATRTQLCEGDVVVCITGAKTGKVAVATAIPESAYVNQHLALIRPESVISPAFLGMSLKSQIGQTYFERAQYGLKQGLSLEDVGEALVLLPPLSEQVALVSYLTEECKLIDTLTTEAQHAIDLLLERRAALISAAVTGQIDVRSVVAA